MKLHNAYTRIDRYILGKYVKSFLLALALIIVIVITFDVSEKLDDFLRNQAPTRAIIFQYYCNFIPNFFNLYSPLFIFVAVIFFTSKMSSHSEIIAILSSGISYKRMLRPYFYGSLIFALAVLLVGNFVIPRSNVQLKDFEGKYIKTMKRSFYNNLHFQAAPGVQVYTQSYDVKQRTAYMFNMDSYDAEGNLKEKISADRLVFDTVSGKWEATSLHRRTFDGYRETMKTDVRTLLDLQLKPDDFNEAARHITTMNSVELYRHIQKEAVRGSGMIKNAKLELYQRLLNPLAIIVMTFIGVAISSRKSRGGLGIHLAVGIAVAFLFIVCMRFCSVFCTNGNLTPFLAVLLPQIIFGGAAVYLIRTAPK